MTRAGARRPHVLVVDDDDRLRALLQKFLARNGFMGDARPRRRATPARCSRGSSST